MYKCCQSRFCLPCRLYKARNNARGRAFRSIAMKIGTRWYRYSLRDPAAGR